MQPEIKLNRKDVAQLAKISAIQVLSSMREQITDVVRHEMPSVIVPVKTEQPPAPAYGRSLFKPQPVEPVSNYTQVLIASIKWRAGKGVCLGHQWLHKTKEKLLVEQYGSQCSVLKMNSSVKKAVFDSTNKMITPGQSIWVQFEPVNGNLQEVVAKLKSKGWEVVPEILKQQLSLVENKEIAA